MAGKFRKLHLELDIYNPNPPTEDDGLLREPSPKPVENTFGVRMAEELSPLDTSIKDCSTRFLVSTYCSCAWQALKLLPKLAAVQLTNVVMYSLLSYKKQPEAAAAFGMYLSFYFVFICSVQFSLIEKFGQEVSRGYGKRDFAYVRKVNMQGLIAMMMMFLVFNLPMLWWADRLLILGSIDPRLIPTTTRCLFLQIFVLLVQLPADMLNAFCMAQGLESEISRIGIIGCLVSSGLQFYLVIYRDFECEAFLYGSMAFGCCSLLNGLLTLLSCDTQTLGFSDFTEATNGLGSYICDTLIFFLSNIGEFLCSNITQYFLAVRHDTTAIAAFGATRGFGAMFYRTGLSLSTVSRTRINILIGMGKHQTAKNFYTFYSIGALLLAAIIGTVGVVFRNQFGMLFAGQSAEVQSMFIKMWVLFCLSGSLGDIGLSPALVGIRAVGKIPYQVVMNFVIASIWHIPCCYLMNKYGVAPQWLVISFGVNITALGLFAFTVSQVSDWSKIQVSR